MPEEVKKVKGWRALVEEAMTKVVRDEITAQINKRFPPVNDSGPLSRERRIVPGFSYEMGRYVETQYASILSKDPEVQELLRQKLKEVIIKGFEEKPQ